MPWSPSVTVAAVIRRQDRFLMVEERSSGRMVINQPAGHLEAGETEVRVDVDGLDPIFNSASSAVEPFGLDANWCWDVLWNVRKSGKVNLVGADVVEYAPYLDPAKNGEPAPYDPSRPRPHREP